MSTLFAQAGVKRDVAAKDALDARTDVADDGARADDDAAHNAKRFHGAITRQFKRRGGQRMRHAHSSMIEHDRASGQKRNLTEGNR